MFRTGFAALLLVALTALDSPTFAQGYRGNYSPGYGPTHGYSQSGLDDFVGRRSSGFYPNSTSRYHYTTPRITTGPGYGIQYGGTINQYRYNSGYVPTPYHYHVTPRYYQPSQPRYGQRW